MNFGPLELGAYLRRQESREEDSAEVRAARDASPRGHSTSSRLGILSGRDDLTPLVRDTRLDAVSVYEAIIDRAPGRADPVRVRVQPGAASAAAAQVIVDEGTVEVWADRERLARVVAGGSWASPAVAPSAAALPAPVDDGTLAAAAAAEASAVGATVDGAPAEAPVGADATQRRRRAPALSATSLPAARDPLAEARAARAAGNPRRALALYRAVAERGGAAGENAEYEIGRVLRDGLHQPREAIAAWRAYRAQHPRGLLRVEADVSVVETLLAIDDKDSAIGEAADFMRRHPDNERRPEMARLRRLLEADRQRR